MNRLITAANDGSLDDSTPEDIKEVAGLEDVDYPVDPKTPCKRVRLVDLEDVSPSNNGSSPTTTRWETAEKEFSAVANRLLMVEGAIGEPDPGVNSASLWSGVQQSDTRISVLEGRCGKPLEDKLLLLQKDVKVAGAMAGGAAIPLG